VFAAWTRRTIDRLGSDSDLIGVRCSRSLLVIIEIPAELRPTEPSRVHKKAEKRQIRVEVH
jgi:hypothetical protein